MNRIPLAKRTLPTYTHGEELFNMISHITGGALGILALVLCVILAAVRKNPYGVIGGAIFGTSMILLYTMSSIYHGLSPKCKAKKVFQIIDHCTIYLLIAGTYSAAAMQMIRVGFTAGGFIIFGIIWGLTILGVTLNAIDLKRYRVISMLLYLGMGWSIFAVASPAMILAILGKSGTVYMLAGGIAYTVGVLFYKLGAKHRYMHSVFHLFCIAGSLLHLMSVLIFL